MIRVFCDFDGTISTEDVGELFFRHFLGERADELVKPLLEGKIGGKEFLRRECELLPPLTKDEVQTFVNKFAVDSTFPKFVAFCNTHKIPLTILSDGLDFYIHTLLQKHSLSHLTFYANKTHFTEVNGKTIITVTFPYTDEECSDCGNCKRNHMLVQSADEDIIVYIGDGFSDQCPIRYADIVFAKRRLIPYCQQFNITYFEYKTFADVQNKMEQLLQRKRLRHRQEAAMARKMVFMQG